MRGDARARCGRAELRIGIQSSVIQEASADRAVRSAISSLGDRRKVGAPGDLTANCYGF
jgi:hypothetical protein